MQFLSTRTLWAGLVLCAALQPSFASAEAEPAALTAQHWQLREVRDAQGRLQPGWRLPPVIPGAGTERTLLLDFTPTRVAVRQLCNGLSGRYRLQGERLHIGALFGTRKACPDEAMMELERMVGDRLPEARAWRIESQGLPAPTLTLSFSDGGQWVLDGTPTDATRHGGPGQTIFLEVGPERVPCHHPLMPQYRCLQVRTLEYDAQGLKTRVGAWENWYAEIKGYTHQPGVRNVLRVLRYPNTNAPADASAFVHVLDMAVETEIVR